MTYIPVQEAGSHHTVTVIMEKRRRMTMIKFGTGGWRAIIGDEFTKKNIQLLAQGLANKMISEGVAEQGIVLGYDRRFLSKEAM